MSKQNITFKNSNGDDLAGVLVGDFSDKSQIPVIFVHGFCSSKDNLIFSLVSEKLSQSNIPHFLFDLRGHGESGGEIDQVTISSTIKDIQSAVQYIKALGFSKYGIVASSFGAFASMIYAAEIESPEFLVLKSTIADYKTYQERYRKDIIPEWKEKGEIDFRDGSYGFKLQYEFYLDALQYDGFESAKKVNCPTLIVNGDQDQLGTYDNVVKLAKVLPDVELVTINGGDHGCKKDPEHKEQMVMSISEFVIQQA